MTNNTTNKFLTLIISSLLLFFFSTLITSSQRNLMFIAPLILFFISIPYCVRFLIANQKPLELMRFFSIVAINVVLFCAITFIHGDSLSTLKTTLIIALTLIPISLLFFQVSFPFKALMVVFIFVGIIYGVIAVYDKFYLDLPRALINRQPIIPAGSIAMTIGLFCLNLTFFLQSQKSKYHYSYTIISFIGALLAILCSILTGSRGTWFPLPLILLWLAWVYLRQNIKHMWYFLLILLIFMGGLIAVPQSGIQQRVAEAKSNLQTCLVNHQCNTSLGLRLEMWKSALLGIKEKPWLGWGERDSFINLKKEQADKKWVIPQIVNYTHTHNYFLDIWVKKGFFVLLAVLAILFYPLYLFHKEYKNNPNNEQKCMAQMGIILIFSTMIYCLSDVFIGLQLGMIFYCLTLALLMGTLFAMKRD